MSTPEATTPSSVGCPGCGYEVGVPTATVCPECGAEIDEDARNIWRARRRIVEGAAAVRTRLLVYGAVAAGFGLGVPGLLVLSWPGRPEGPAELALAGLTVFVGCAAAFFGGEAAGLAPYLATPEGSRPIVRLVWVRHILWLHVPWMSIPGFALVLWAVAGGLGLGTEASVLTIVACFAGWAWLCIWARLHWLERFRRDWEACGLGPGDGPPGRWIGLAALAVFLGAVLLGFVAGAAASAAIVQGAEMSRHPLNQRW